MLQKCPVCSSEITFKTDPKNGDFTPEHGATRNFDNWKEDDPNGNLRMLPGAEEDEDYDSEGNDKETRAQRDAMADLERSQEQSRREMEVMDELADLRSRNARVDTNRVGDDPTALLSALHAERESKEEEKRRQEADAEDDALVAQYFTKIPPPKHAGAETEETDEDGESGGGEEKLSISAITIKRRTGPLTAGEPTVDALLAAKGKAAVPPASVAPPVAQVKRKRGDMQKILGIKKKAKA